VNVLRLEVIIKELLVNNPEISDHEIVKQVCEQIGVQCVNYILLKIKFIKENMEKT
jgi:hypothetical protein